PAAAPLAPQPRVLLPALRPRIAAEGPVRSAVHLAAPRTVARVGRVARTARGIAARRSRRLEAVVVARAHQARVLVHALRPRITAEGPVGGMVHLAAPRAIARVGRVARTARRIAARRSRRLEAVVVARARLARVLVHALRPRIAARGPVGGVVRLAGARTIAGVGGIARTARRIAARRPRRLEA